MKTVLTIAGSDSSGGAGIQADLKTIEAHGCYGMSVVTAVTAQNTRGVAAVEELSPEIVEKQLWAVLGDIRPDAVKIGMVYGAENVRIIRRALEQWQHGPVVLDPVMVSTSGRPLLQPEAKKALEEELFPLAALLTPNLPEAGALLGEEPALLDSQMEQAAGKLGRRYGTAVLLKGGHRQDGAADVLWAHGQLHWFRGERVSAEKGSHGTGCTLSSAVACNLALGITLPEAVEAAKAYVTGALLHAPGLGQETVPCVTAG